MELTVVEDTKKRFVFKLKGVTHAFCNAVKEELWNSSHTTAAGYHVEHPLVGIPQFIVESDGKVAPKQIVLDAIKRLKKLNEKAKKEFLKEL